MTIRGRKLTYLEQGESFIEPQYEDFLRPLDCRQLVNNPPPPPTDSERETTVKVSSARTMPQHLETGLQTTEMTEYGKHGKPSRPAPHSSHRTTVSSELPRG